jgi:quercetin dioxygenase-like cupin family protein
MSFSIAQGSSLCDPWARISHRLTGCTFPCLRTAWALSLVAGGENVMDYTFFASLASEISLPDKGILSNVVRKDEFVNITAFGFAAGQELSAHAAPTPAAIYFLEGEAEVLLGKDTVSARAGSFVYMPPLLVHGISAKSPVKMLLIQVKAGAN